jgi:glycosyltransferase involved in cell wall biosynthesis
MFGWEFPPFKSGGLGTHCYGLTKAMSSKNVQVTFVMPKAPGTVKSDFVKLLAANQVSGYQIDSSTGDLKSLKIITTTSTLSSPYLTPEQYQAMIHKHSEFFKQNKNILSMKGGRVLIHNDAAALSSSSNYGQDLFDEVYRYALKAEEIASIEEFDIIHCHDWMTYQAGMRAKAISGRPLVVTVHSTGFDRTGGHPHQYEYDIEKMGMNAADSVIAVSEFTKQQIVKHYGIHPKKINVVYNAVDHDVYKAHSVQKLSETDKIVLFLGRVTIQKGPDYFIEAAKKVVEIDPNVKFVVAGTGDMLGPMIDRVAQYGLADKFIWAGFVSGKDVDRCYQLADVYVMPSISEPFGITPLESIANGTPVIISKQSGVSEVLTNALKVDFWDIDEMANKILAVLKYRELHHELKSHGKVEVRSMTWDRIADKTINVYEKTLTGVN